MKKIMYRNIVLVFLCLSILFTACTKKDGFDSKNELPLVEVKKDATANLLSGTAVYGYVLDSATSTPLVGVQCVRASTMTGASTDITGFFNIVILGGGTEKIIFSYVGYKTVEKTISLGGPQYNMGVIKMAEGED